jgi:hypothetical protein
MFPRTTITAALLLLVALPTVSAANQGIWISAEELAAIPNSGPAWDHLVDRANEPACTPVLEDQTQSCNVTILAKALVYARTGDVAYQDDVVAALVTIATYPVYTGRSLALGQRLGAYIVAADLVDLEIDYPALHVTLVNKLLELRDTPTIDGPDSIVDAHEVRLNNWGTTAGFTRLLIDLYANDPVDLAAAVDVWKGWMGDRDTYSDFNYEETNTWHPDPLSPRPINPVGATIDGYDVDGVLPASQNRGGPFAPPPYSCERNVATTLQGAVCATIVLDRLGLGASSWQDSAMKRAIVWFTETAGCALENDDEFQAPLFNLLYPELGLPVDPDGAQAGKVMGFTDWSHSDPASVGVELMALDPGPARLTEVHPNPFATAATVQMSLERRSRVLLRVVDVSGRGVRTLYDGVLSAGPHRMTWDGRRSDGRNAAAGVYFVTMSGEGATETRKIVRFR